LNTYLLYKNTKTLAKLLTKRITDERFGDKLAADGAKYLIVGMYPRLIIWYGMGSGTVRKNRLDSVGKTDAQGDAKKKENPVSSLF